MIRNLLTKAALLATAPALAAGLLVAPGAIGSAHAAICSTCDDGGGSTGGSGGTTTMALSGTGTDGVTGNLYGWNGGTSQYITEKLHTNPIDGHSAWWMDTTATLDKSSGLVQRVTHTESDELLAGYTGGVYVLALDSYGNILGHTDTADYGVDGKWIGQWSRDDAATDVMHGSNLGATTRLMVVQFHDPHPKLLSELACISNAVLSGSWQKAISGTLTCLAS